MKKNPEINELLSAAIDSAIKSGFNGMDSQIQEAVRLGATIGAAVGADTGAAAAVRAVERERTQYRQKQRDRRLHNTKLLLRNYRRLSEYERNAVFDTAGAEEADENFEDIMSGKFSDDEVFAESILRNYVRTKIIMTHVNKMLECYRYMCENSKREDDKRHWRVLDAMYLSGDGTTADEVADQEHIDRRTVYRDLDTCAEDLTALFFGIGGVK